MDQNDSDFMQLALNQARMAQEIGEVPIGAVIIDPQIGGNLSQCSQSSNRP